MNNVNSEELGIVVTSAIRSFCNLKDNEELKAILPLMCHKTPVPHRVPHRLPRRVLSATRGQVRTAHRYIYIFPGNLKIYAINLQRHANIIK